MYQTTETIFVIGQRVSFVISPLKPVIIYKVEHDVDGRPLYCVTFVDGDDKIVSNKFYGCELLDDEE